MKKLFLILLLITFVSLSGCGKKDDKSQTGKDDKKSEEVKKENTNGDTPVGDDKIKLNDLGMSKGLPKNYPLDIPQPKNSSCIGNIATSEGTMVTFESSDNIKDIVNFFTEELKKNGYEQILDKDQKIEENVGILIWKKGDKNISIQTIWSNETSKSQIVITY